MRITALAPLLAGCAYTPQQVACMHARSRAEHRGGMVGLAVAVVLVVATVVVNAGGLRGLRPSWLRTSAAAAVVVAAVWPVGTYLSLVGVWWAGRSYHCGDELNLHAANLASAVLGYALFLVAPGLIAVALSGTLLFAARRIWLDAAAAPSPVRRSTLTARPGAGA